MPVNDPIADLLTRLRNAQHGRRTECVVPWSTMKQSICELLKTEGYLSEVRVEGEGAQKMITSVFVPGRCALLLKRVSTPGGRTYIGFDGIRRYLHGAGLAILSTSQGLLTDKQARQKKVGGELLCTVA